MGNATSSVVEATSCASPCLLVVPCNGAAAFAASLSAFNLRRRACSRALRPTSRVFDGAAALRRSAAAFSLDKPRSLLKSMAPTIASRVGKYISSDVLAHGKQ